MTSYLDSRYCRRCNSEMKWVHGEKRADQTFRTYWQCPCCEGLSHVVETTDDEGRVVGTRRVG